MPIGKDGGAGAISVDHGGFFESFSRALEQVSALRDSVERLSGGINSVLHDQTSNLFEFLISFWARKSLGEAMQKNEALMRPLFAFDIQSGLAEQKQHHLDLDAPLAFAQASTLGMSFTTEQTSQAYDMLAVMLRTAPAFQGADRFQNFAAIAPIILRASEVAQMRGPGLLDDNIRALVQYAHLIGNHGPASTTRGTDQLLAIAEATELPFSQLENIMRMAIPMAHSVNAYVPDTALFTAALIQGGLGGSTHRYSRSEMNEHAAALLNLGLMNSAGQLTVLNAQGGGDIARGVADIDAAGHRMDPIAFGNALRNAFSLRGQRGAELLKVMDQLTPALFAAVNSTPGTAAQQAAFAATPLQQFEQIIARLQDIGNILATTILPDFLRMETGLLAFLNAVDDFLAHHHVIASIIGHALGGAAVGFTFGGPAGALVLGGAGAAVGAVESLPAGNPVPHEMPGYALSQEALFGRHDEPGQITVNAPLTVTVQGDMLGDYANLSAFLSQWWAQNAGSVGNTVKQQIQHMQRQSRRMTMQDMQQADGYTAAIADGAGYR